MKSSTDGLVLAADAAIDLQVHTHYSDGKWTPEALIDHLRQEGFRLAAITDHDRADTAPELQRLALEKGMPILIAAEVTASWKGEMTDVLCFGFDPEKPALSDLTKDVLRRQQDNTREVYTNIVKKGYTFANGEAELKAILEKPSAQQPHELVALLQRHEYGTGDPSVGKILMEAGFAWAMTDIAAAVEAAHQSGGVALLAHPGRDDGFVCYNADLLDELRADVPIDGFEAYYPKHTAEQTTMFVDYARRHDLLTSSGSDSHAPDKPPIKYRAELSRKLLERVGIRVAG